jgi:hypothetical protein
VDTRGTHAAPGCCPSPKRNVMFCRKNGRHGPQVPSVSLPGLWADLRSWDSQGPSVRHTPTFGEDGVQLLLCEGSAALKLPSVRQYAARNDGANHRVPTKNSVRIEIIDVGSLPLLSFPLPCLPYSFPFWAVVRQNHIRLKAIEFLHCRPTL